MNLRVRKEEDELVTVVGMEGGGAGGRRGGGEYVPSLLTRSQPIVKKLLRAKARVSEGNTVCGKAPARVSDENRTGNIHVSDDKDADQGEPRTQLSRLM
eukprot:764254-Hanusia_phi.AAC.3